jgi:predicted O-linked N-acetylglucosamine transferase (SPINDLY family)
MAEGMLPAIQPHHALVYPLTAAQQLAIAASYSHHARKAMLGMGAKPVVWAPASTAVRLAAALPLALRRTLRPELLQALSRAQIADAAKAAVVGATASAASDSSPGAEASADTTVTGTGHRVSPAADGGVRDSGDSERARTAAADTTGATSTPGAAVASDPAAPRRLRVGFVSSDLGDHPLSHLMRHVFIWMDRRRFEVHCYATAPDDGSSWRREIASGVEAFHDAASLSHAQLAGLIHSHGIDVAINLNGFTKGSRSEAFALCPAPIQVMYLGFPGSSGSAYHQYVVTDGVTTPVELGRCFTERLAHMSRSYFVNDHAQAYSACAAELTDAQVDAARAALGLPPRPAIVYCMHNQLYKCDPRTFDAWARILARVPNSVLWLLQFPPSGEAHIRQEARARGLAHWRFVFSPVAPKDEHIQRLRIADLFLDTPLCNAHTTVRAPARSCRVRSWGFNCLLEPPHPLSVHRVYVLCTPTSRVFPTTCHPGSTACLPCDSLSLSLSLSLPPTLCRARMRCGQACPC